MKKFILPLTLINICLINSNVFASDSINTIPLANKPGTILEIDKNYEVKTKEFDNSIIENSKQDKQFYNLKNSEKINTITNEEKLVKEILDEAKKYPIYYYNEEFEIPKMEEGMKIYYDGMGYLTKIVDKNGNNIPFKNKCNKVEYPQNYMVEKSYTENGTFIWGKDSNKLTRTSDHVLAQGWITWYDGVGQIGDHNNILNENDCATAMSYDRPPSNTEIFVRNLENDNTGYVYKNDVGGLPNAILDIMPTTMKNVFGAKVNTSSDTGRFKGRYYYEIDK